MGSDETRSRVPAHLRHHVIEQDWDAYTPVDHAVWRFVLVQLYERLVDSAHPAYRRGLEQAGMGVERIPRVADMDNRLRDFGWGAVCVDGFIPPRAFQEFQALGILPIAAEIRRVEHLAYTPAPDIIHEAGGHAPILPDALYARFLRRIGDYGMQAFGSSHDQALYEAVRGLSVVKAQRDATSEQVHDAEQALTQLVATGAEAELSEATRLARLYWWTVEYGLVGTLGDYRLYGAGLLSSLGESHFCSDPQVRKWPLDAHCVDVGYDITRPQPQLFVARDFVELSDVLEQVCAGFAFKTGGLAGLQTAAASGEVATVLLEGGLAVTGTVRDALQVGAALLVRFDGECALARDGRQIEGHSRERYPAGIALLLGTDPRLAVTTWAECEREEAADIPSILEAAVRRGDELLHAGPLVHLVHLAGPSVTRVLRGAIDPDYWPAATWPQQRVPKRVSTTAMHGLFARVLDDSAGTTDAGADLLAVGDVLDADHPGEWLLRFYLLQALQRLDLAPGRRGALVSQLASLERHYGGRCPIATGLRYLGMREP